ncbi:hypothetical protein CHH28_08020 [Bacterioplanes sanyensis]|uniref:HTH merR-type domain-containing protein n=1 Tax=Bacterioplanes sanyensis TaxID=1249553 RepID=A0A222FJ58_9GAMM|nr:MerR family transcriptional regulator [Bacterioplanes sanyensis]ASP38626.1 hypothetical protein CHH28_08020 [Bacterioplanes sanyensis]
MTSPHDEPQAAYYPIRVVSNETGVNAITLRAWERRYGLITPKRTAKGHRLYTEDDIRLIKQVVTLLNRGIPISQARAMLDHDQDASDIGIGLQTQPSQWHQYREQLSEAVQAFDDQQLGKTFDEVSQFFPIDIALRFLLIPIYAQLRDSVTQPLGHARLRFYSGFLHARLAWRLSEQSQRQPQASILVASVGQDDNIELLLTAILLKQMGLRCIWMNGLLSANNIVECLTSMNWQAALLQLPSTADQQQLGFVKDIAVESGRPVFVSGAPATLHDTLRQLGVIALQDDVQQAALNIRDLLTGAPA